MQFVCDAPEGKTWFRIETEGEAAIESNEMNHAVEKHFRIEREKAKESYRPASTNYIERDIGLNAHVQRHMPLFLTLRDSEGKALVTAMLPPGGCEDEHFRVIIVAAGNADPYPDHEAAIAALGIHFGIALDRERCFPYRRS
ncbi:MAG: hypothetical protein WAW96_18600 [Alphaproteobacteria bacterium]